MTGWYTKTHAKMHAKTIRIALLDDHAVVRHGLLARLESEADLQVVGSYGATTELMQALRMMSVDILLTDYELGNNDIDGLNLIRTLKLRYPLSKILVLSSHFNSSTVLMALRAGAHGFVGKAQSLAELVAAIRSLFVGNRYLSPMMTVQISSLFSEYDTSLDISGQNFLIRNGSLSPREREVLRCCLSGLSVTEISEKFSRSIKTISSQKQAALRKLGLRNDIDLFRIQHQLQDL